MLNAVLQTMNRHEEIWANETRVSEIVTELQVRFDNMESLFQEKLDLGVAYSGVKKEDWHLFGRKLVLLTGYLHDIALQKNMHDKVLHLKLTESQFMRSSMQQAATLASSILNVGTNFTEDLAVYSDGPELLETINNMYKEFLNTGLLPSQRRKRRAEVNIEIRTQISEIRQILSGNLDMVMRRYIDVEREFYTEYSRSRVTPKFSGSSAISINENDPEEANASPPENDPDDSLNDEYDGENDMNDEIDS